MQQADLRAPPHESGDAPPEIRVLAPLVAAQIAAGEVVERPASVVKELIDNAVDARASLVSVELEQGGVELVRVSDNGHGMGPAQLPMAVAPHATSKITDAQDLDRVTTMGFRGEALASIASVSRLSIRSRCASDASAWSIHVEGAHVSPARPEAGPVGTSISVRNLFFNTPARRKFLRSTSTEQGHAADAVRAMALSHPHIGFVLKVDGRVTLDLPPGQQPRDRAMAVIGREMESQYIEVHADQFDDARGVALWGLVGKPALARPTTGAQHLFVNGRPVRDKTVTHALREAYRGLIEPGRHPAALLSLAMDPGAVDVNVHPAKAEVRFRDSGLIHAVVFRAVRDALQAADLTPQASASWGAIGARGLHPGAVPASTSGVSGASAPGGAASGAGRLVDFLRAPQVNGNFDYASIRDAMALERAAAEPGLPPHSSSTGATAGPGAPSAASPAPPEPALARPVPAQRVLQVHNSYLVTQDEQGVLIIDQHALHERVMYERLRARLTAGPLESQRLLTPALAQAAAQRLDLLPALGSILERLGIDAQAIGPNELAVHAFPTFLLDKRVDPGVFVAELLERAHAERWVEIDAAARAGDAISEAMLHDILDMMACKAAVKAGDALSDTDLRELLDLRDRLERASNCPHGRPTTVRVSLDDLARLFGRS